MFVAVLRDLFGLFGGWCFCFLRLHQLDGLHAAEAADVADDGPAALPLASSALELIAQLISALEQIFMFEQIENSQCRGAGERIAGEGAAQAARTGSVHDFGAASDGSEWQAAAQGFCCD